MNSKKRILNLPHRVLILLLLANLHFAAYAKQDELTLLFSQLKSATSEQSATPIESQIWQLWFQSGNQEIDDLMQRALLRRNSYDFNGAIEFLNKIIALDPGYAEAWNQRATVLFHQEKFEDALWDVAKTLELEPRHFGALAGRAIIRLRQNKPVIARRNIEEALKLHPFLKERSFFPDLAK